MDSLCNWQATKQKLAQCGKHILKMELWIDCKFIVGQQSHQKILGGHKLILAMASPVFEAMFFGKMAEENDPIPITDVQPEVFEALLEYIYEDNVNFKSFELVYELCYCAKKYIFPFLDKECTKFLSLNLSPEKACRGYEFAKLFEKPVLMEECLEIIHAEANTILKNPSFEEIQLETLIALFEQEKLQIYSEIELVSAAERWASSECLKKGLDPEDGESLRSVIGNALTKVRFLTLTPQKFAAGPARSSLLKKKETLAILINILSNEQEWPMPRGFSTIITPRKKRVVQSNPDDHHCCRVEIEYAECLETEVLVSSLTFTVNRDICVIGVGVPTQVSVSGNDDNEPYFEDFFAELYDPSGTRLIEECFIPEIYRVVVNFQVPGTYPMAQCRQRISCNDTVSFSFGIGNSADNIQNELIRSIIFSKDTYYYD